MVIAVCFHRFGPYHVARLTAAAQRMKVVGIEFSSKTTNYDWNPVESGQMFRRIVVVPGGDIRTLPKADQRRRVWQVLDDLTPDVVAVNGWGTLDALAVLSWTAKRRVPVIMMSETTAWDFKRSVIKEWIKKRLVQRLQTGLVGGSVHADYLERLGMAAPKIFKGYDVVDNSYFTSMVDQRQAGERSSQIPPNCYFLASSRFIPKKNLGSLLDAYAMYRQMIGSDGWEMVLLGDGDLRPELERRRSSLQLDSVFHMPGFIQYNNLPDFYAWAGAFIHASTTEQWGLVVNEAMASGLPVLVSDRCGCTADLVENGRNGFVFDPSNVNALAQLMLKISSNDCDRTKMSSASREIISRWTPKTFADGLSKAVDVALASPRPQAGWMDKALLWALSLR